MSTQNEFLPSGYNVPSSESSYLKFQTGENKFRILSKPIIGWLDWDNKKPFRFPMNQKPSKPIDPAKPVKHFWAFVVWDYNAKKISILEITQKSIMSAIQSLTADGDWGSPFDYDIKVTKTGTDMQTQYSVNPVPHKAVHVQILDLYEKTPVNLNALFEGKDPFEVQQKSTPQSTRNDGLPNDFATVDDDLDSAPF